MIHDSVPRGVDGTFNKQVRTWGDIPKFDFEVKDDNNEESLDLRGFY